MDTNLILNTKRVSKMAHNTLSAQVDHKEEMLLRLAQISPNDVPGGIPGLRSHIQKLKAAHQSFIDDSTSLSQQLLRMGAKAQTDEVRTQRRKAREEVHEFISIANDIFKDAEEGSVSNVDVMSVYSHRSAPAFHGNTPGVEARNTVENFLKHVITQPPPSEPFERLQDNNVLPFDPSQTTVAAGISPANTSQTTVAAGISSVNTSQTTIAAGIKTSNSSQPLQTTIQTGIPNPVAAGGAPIMSLHPSNNPNISTVPPGAVPTINNPQWNSPHMINPIISSGVHPQQQYFTPYVLMPTVGSQSNPMIPPGFNVSQGNLPSSASNATLDLTRHLLTKDLLQNVIEPFDGISYKFHTWKEQIQAKIRPLSLTPVESLHVMKSNSAKSARNIIENKIASTLVFTPQTVTDMWEILEERYAKPTTVANDLLGMMTGFRFSAYRGKPSSLSVGKQLLQLHDIGQIVQHNMQFCPDLRILNDPRGLREIRLNLPPDIRNKC